MKNQKEINETEILGWGGVKWYKENIVEMVEKIEEEKFLSQIHTILKKHIEKRGD